MKNEVCDFSGLKCMSIWKVRGMQRFERITALGYSIFSILILNTFIHNSCCQYKNYIYVCIYIYMCVCVCVCVCVCTHIYTGWRVSDLTLQAYFTTSIIYWCTATRALPIRPLSPSMDLPKNFVFPRLWRAN